MTSRRSIAALIATLVVGFAIPCAAQAPTPGLVAAYGFEEAGGSTVSDSSGNSNTGVILGAIRTTQGRFGGALSFDGINDYVLINDSNSLRLSSAMTLEAWVYATVTSGVRDIVIKEGSNVDIYNLYARNGQGRPESNVFVGGTNRTAEGTALPANTWTHMAGTYDGTTLRLFINGVQVASTTVSGPIASSTGPLRIGGNGIWGEFFQGLIDEVRVYNRALSQSEIQGDMNTPVGAGAPPPPPPPPPQVGQWSGPFPWPIVAVHMTLLSTGEVLAWDESSAFPAQLWNPATNTFTPVPNGFSNMFCAGHCVLSDGRVLVAGGHIAAHVGIPDVNIFDPVIRSWSLAAPMAFPRWYPTVTCLSDGHVLVTAGETTCDTCNAEIPELYDPTTNTWTTLSSAPLNMPYYPFVFVLPDGRVLSAGSGEESTSTHVLSLGTQTWTVVDPVAVDGGSSAMYLPGKVIKAGKATTTVPPYVPTVATTYVLDMTQPAPAWRQTSPMAFARAYHQLTLLPDGNVLATGGSGNTSVYDLGPAVYEAEMWSPVTETWTTMAPAQVARVDHSTAVLLPDARVLVAGSGRDGPTADQLNAEIYAPPYLFKGVRPAIAAAPSIVQYGTNFLVQTPDASRIARVTLVRPSSVTHGFNQDQRFVELTFQTISGDLNVQAPASGNLVPPGYYMLFILDTDGVPSVASFVRFPSPTEDVDPPAPPGNLVATGSIRAVSLSWAASTDNVGVSGYNVHRSTSTGFLPSPANRIAQTGSTSYIDANLSPGTYFYVVTAQDAATNVSAPSGEVSAAALPDTTPPTVSLTAPTAGSTVAGLITVSANASDDVGVAGVQFLLDGAPLGNEVTTAPYSMSWVTTTTPNGSHTLSARARDVTGNTATAPGVTITVSNAQASGPVAAYSFNEGSGNQVADASGNGHLGTISGATWITAGKFGKALSFNGTSNRITVADSNLLDLTTGMTLMAWVYPTSTTGVRDILIKEGSSVDIYNLYARNGQGRPESNVFVWGTNRTTEGTALPANTWTHMAGTYDGTILRLFINGVQVSSTAVSGPMPASTGPLRIGGNSIWGEYFKGRIDEVRIYNRALTAAEIQTDMATPIK